MMIICKDMLTSEIFEKSSHIHISSKMPLFQDPTNDSYFFMKIRRTVKINITPSNISLEIYSV